MVVTFPQDMLSPANWYTKAGIVVFKVSWPLDGLLKPRSLGSTPEPLLQWAWGGVEPENVHFYQVPVKLTQRKNPSLLEGYSN